MNPTGQQFGNGRVTKPQPVASAAPRGIFVPPKYRQEEASVSDRSLQINIDSEDDAKSVIQNLPAIKAAYEASGVTSVEFCIAESVVKATENILLGAVCWCRTYVKHIAPQPGNVLFPLPAFVDLSRFAPITAPPTPSVESTIPAEAPTPPTKPLVKPQRPVRAESARE